MTDSSDRVNLGAIPTPVILIAMLAMDSLHHVFARALRPFFPSTIAGFWVMTFATLMIAAYMGWHRQIRWSVFRQHYIFFLTIGSLIALATWLSYESLVYIDAGTAALLSRVGIIVALALGIFWLKERLDRIEWLGATISLIGVLVISFQPGISLRWGAIYIVLASTAYTLHTAVVKRYGQEIDFANFFLFRVGTTAVFSLFIALNQEGTVIGEPVPLTAWGLLALVALFDVVISRVLYYWALRAIDLSYHTIILMASPVVTIGWSLLLFREQPTLQAILGGAAVLLGQFIINRYKQRTAKIN